MVFGTELQDFKAVDTYITNSITFDLDVRDFLKERTQIEREYAKKLEELSRRYKEKAEKRATPLSVGWLPVVPASGEGQGAEMNTVQKAWLALLTNMDLSAKDRMKFTEDASVEVLDKLKVLGQRVDDSRKKHMNFAARLSAELEVAFGEKDKARTKYLEACDGVEAAKVRFERAPPDDPKTQDKLKRQWNAEILRMRDQKNVYLLTVESTNAASKRFYSVDLPQLLENMQSLKESETTSFKSLLTAFCTLDRSSHEQLLRHLEVVSTSCNAIDAASDCAMFSRHNRKGIADAPKFSFESTPMWVDNSELEQDHESRVVLVNKLAKHRARLSDVGDEVAGKSKEVMGLTTLRDSYRRDPHLGDPEVVHEQLLDSQRDLVFLDITRAKLQAQIDTISGQIGDAQQDGPSHKFKQSNFTLPTACDLCGQSIWGMGKGRACSECGFNVHNRCELKVPPVCSCVKGSGHTRPASSGSRKTSYNADTASNRASVIANGADQSPNASGRLSPGSLLGAGGRVLTTMESSISVTSSLSRAIYSYTKQDDEEISIKSGDVVQIIEQDSDGWTKISVDGREGIVPTSYLEPCSAASGSTPSTATTMTHGLSPSSATQKARTLGSATMLYDYDAQNDEEVSVKEGSPVKLVEDERDGWVKVAFNGREGLVPVSYLQIR